MCVGGFFFLEGSSVAGGVRVWGGGVLQEEFKGKVDVELKKGPIPSMNFQLWVGGGGGGLPREVVVSVGGGYLGRRCGWERWWVSLVTL